MARAAIRSARWRSSLTMLGIVIGIVSVVTIVSLGEGVKQNIVGRVDDAGYDLITVHPGRTSVRSSKGQVQPATLFGAGGGSGTFSDADLGIIRSAHGVQTAAPFAHVNGIASYDGRQFTEGPIIATTEDATKILRRKTEYGSFFSGSENGRSVAIIGKRVAEQLFQENVPIAKLFTIRGQQFVVKGIFEEFDTSPLSGEADYNSAIFIPLDAAKKLNGDQSQIYQVIAKSDPKSIDLTAAAITDSLSKTHSGQVDFTVMKPSDTSAITRTTLNAFTGFIAGIAAISLLVAGIGILNIMLVSVTERTHEIGIRKAVGATNRQILNQFLTEAIILSVSGGILGVVFSLLTNYILRVTTDLAPVLTWPIMAVAVGVSVVVGVVFGIAPALKAARMHPIDALRNE